MTHLHPLKVVFDPRLALGFAHCAAKNLVDRQRHVVKAGQPRQQGVVLEDYRALGTRPGDFAVITQQSAFRG